jgi:hypothetical protein
VTDGLSIPERAVDGAGTIVASLPCRRCGYDLRGLSKSGNCPECGDEILPSLGTWLIRFAPVDWIARVVRGTFLSAVGFGSCVASPSALLIFAPFGADTGPIAMLVIAGLGLVLDVAGSWMLSARPVARGSGGLFELDGRAGSRTSVIVFASFVLGAILSACAELYPLFFLGLLGCLATIVVWHLVQLGYARQLLLRIPEDRLTSWVDLAQFLFTVASLGVVMLFACADVVASFRWGIAIASLPLALLLAYPLVMLRVWAALRKPAPQRAAAGG